MEHTGFSTNIILLLMNFYYISAKDRKFSICIIVHLRSYNSKNFKNNLKSEELLFAAKKFDVCHLHSVTYRKSSIVHSIYRLTCHSRIFVRYFIVDTPAIRFFKRMSEWSRGWFPIMTVAYRAIYQTWAYRCVVYSKGKEGWDSGG